MTRHSKNCTANTVYTYHEKQKDAKHSGYGTTSIRVGKDSIRELGCCCLTLQPAKDPVVTPDGYLYDKAAILEYIINQKADIKRKLKIYQKQLDRDEKEKQEQLKNEKEEAARNFLAFNSIDSHAFTSSGQSEKDVLLSRRAVAVEHVYKPGKAASFWHPSTSSQSEHKGEHKIAPKMPDTVIRCPMSKKPLKFKDLIDVVFKTKPSDNDPGKVIYCCAISNDTLTNATPCVVLKTSGTVVTETVVKDILKHDMVDPCNGKKLVDEDFIPLVRGSLGFADDKTLLTAKRTVPSMQI